MPALRIETSQLLIYDPDKSRTTVHCFVARPTPLEERMLGRLFLLVEIDSRDPATIEVLHALQQEVSAQYYQSDEFNAESAFERALQRTNERLHDLLTDTLEAWVARANILIAVLKDTSLHFSVIGRLHAFLIHRQRIVDILDTSTGATADAASPLKIFSNIVSGQLRLDDALLFCTPSLLDYLSQEKLKRIVSERPAPEAVRSLESLLAEADATASFGALIANITALPVAEAQTPVTATPHDAQEILQPQRSMEELIRRERQTNDLLTHPLWPNVGRLLKTAASGAQGAASSLLRAKRQEQHKEEDQQPRAASWHGRPERRRSVLQSILRGSIIAVGVLARILVRVLGWIAALFTRPAVRQRVRSLPAGTNHRLAGVVTWFRRLSRTRRLLFVAAIVLLVVFAQSVVFSGKSQERSQRHENAVAALARAQELVSAADAALLIQNESGARKNLQDAATELGSIPESEKALRNDAETVSANIQDKLQTLRHAVAVDPALVVDLANADAAMTPKSLLAVNTTLYSFNGRTDTVYRIDTEKKTIETVVDAPSLAYHLQYFVPGGQNLFAYQSDGNLQQIQTAQKTLATTPVQYQNVDRDVRSGMVYNNRLYTLDARNGQIFRHERSGNGYAQGKSWVTDSGVDLREARSLVIDGSVYVLRTGGEVVKLTNGKRDSAVFEAVDPALQEPLMLALSEAGTLLVLDPSQQRIVEYAKDGAFHRQYVAPSLSNAVSFSVAKNVVYVLSGTQVVQFALQAE